VDEFLPAFAWVFGPGANGKGHSFTLSGEGNIHRQILALHWLSHAPVIGGWTFYAARQPGEIEGHRINFDGRSFDPKEIWVTPVIDTDDESIDLTVWHPAWAQIEQKHQRFVTFLFLDEALGEYGTGSWVGSVGFGKDKLAGVFPLEELAAYVRKIATEHGWKEQVPGSLWTLFSTKDSSGDFPRADSVTQTTCVPRLVTEFMRAEGEYDDPLKGTGADYVYVSIDGLFFPKGQEVSRRSEIEEAVESALAKFDGGRCVGGAFGTERSYSDFLIFDGDRSLGAIQKVLRKQKVPAGYDDRVFRPREAQPPFGDLRSESAGLESS
jgi:hypothetical protein